MGARAVVVGPCEDGLQGKENHATSQESSQGDEGSAQLTQAQNKGLLLGLEDGLAGLEREVLQQRLGPERSQELPLLCVQCYRESGASVDSGGAGWELGEGLGSETAVGLERGLTLRGVVGGEEDPRRLGARVGEAGTGFEDLKRWVVVQNSSRELWEEFLSAV